MSEVKNGFISILGGSSNANGTHMHYWIADGCKEIKSLAEAYNSKNELVDTMTLVSRYLRCNWGCDGKHNGIYSVHMFSANIPEPHYIGDTIIVTPIDTGAIIGPVIVPSRSIDSDPDLQYYKYNLQAITGIRK